MCEPLWARHLFVYYQFHSFPFPPRVRLHTFFSRPNCCGIARFLLRRSASRLPRKQSQVRLQPFQSSGQIENDFNAGEIVAADSPKRFYSAQTANGIPIKVVTVVSRGPRGEKKVMFAINQNRPELG